MSVAIAVSTTLSSCRSASVIYGEGEAQVRALIEVDLSIAPGESVALQGPSGSGKTTLLHLLGGLLVPSAGEVLWKGEAPPKVALVGFGSGVTAGATYCW